jgi:hypothetical protein
MRIRNEPAPPAAKFAGMVLYQATERNTNEVRLARDEEDLAISLDGDPLSPPKSELFPVVVKAILRFAGIRLWPWSKKLSGKRLDVKFESSGSTSSWIVETPNIEQELILKRI